MLKLLTICLFTASFLSTLTACDGYPKSELRYLDTSPTLRGDDEDENGVRDDLDIYINTTPLTDIQKIALSQYAESLQSSLLINTSDKIAAKASERRAGRDKFFIKSPFFYQRKSVLLCHKGGINHV